MIEEGRLKELLKFDIMTKEQIKAITSKTPLLVSASAGSGKTFVLATRVVYNILSEKRDYSPQKILVVTFTRAAASEMKNRIIEIFENVAQNIEVDGYLLKKKSELELMKIMTIDSFCVSLLREYFQYADVSPDFSLSDENQIAKYKQDAIEELFEQEYENNPKEFQRLSDYFSLKGDYELNKALLEVNKYIKKQAFEDSFIENIKQEYTHPQKIYNTRWAKEITGYIKEEIDRVKLEFILYRDILKKDRCLEESFMPVVDLNVRKLDELSQKIYSNDYITNQEIIENFRLMSFPRFHKEKNPFDRDLADEYKKHTVVKFRRTINNIKEKYFIKEQEYKKDMKEQEKIIEYLLNLNDGYKEIFNEKKRNANTLDFDDLINKTVKLLAKNEHLQKTEIGEHIQEEFDEILVDEYQDVNEIQDTLFNLLSKQNENLFMVGDIKQSIYRFRQADTDMFLNREKSINKNNIIYLKDNFRSKKQVIDSVNSIFKGIMSEDFGGVNYDKTQMLNSKLKNNNSNDCATEMHFLKVQSKGKQAIIDEADHIAYTINKMINDKFQIEEKDGISRECRLGDFAILLRSAQNTAQIFEDRLKRAGISVKQDGLTGYFKSKEIMQMVSLLKVVDNPLVDMHLLNVLLSPIFNFTVDEILNIRSVDKESSLYSCILKTMNKKCKKFIKTLHELRDDAFSLPLSEFIQKIYDTTSYYALCGADKKGDQKTANLRLLLSYAKGYETESSGGLNGFLNMIDRIKSMDKDFETANVESDRSRAVRIMTIHKSKGLEFPIVFLARTSLRFNEKEIKKPLLITKKYKIAMKTSNPKKLTRFNTLPYAASSVYEKKMSKQEELRILYVATTRAREKLIITTNKSIEKFKKYDHIKNKENLPLILKTGAVSYDEWIYLASQSDKSIVFKEGIHSLKIENKKENHIKIAKKRLLELDIKLSYEYSNIELSKIPLKMTVSDIVRDKGLKKIDLKSPKFDDRLTATQRGTATHLFLQYANYENASNDIEKEIKRLQQKEFISKKQATALNKGSIKRFFSSKLYRRIKNANKVEREKSFLYELNANQLYSQVQDEKILIQGIIDCMIEEKDGLIIVDYKTDRKDEKQLKKEYKRQLELYKQAIEGLQNKKVKECLIYSLYLNKTIDCI